MRREVCEVLPTYSAKKFGSYLPTISYAVPIYHYSSIMKKQQIVVIFVVLVSRKIYMIEKKIIKVCH